MKKSAFLLAGSLFALSASTVAQNPKFAPLRADIPLGGKLAPRQEEPVFAVCSKQGMRILVSRDDGKTWKQTFLATASREDGGWHGNYAVYGMAYTEGVIGVFSGWGTPGIYIGSDDGVNWAHLNKEPVERLGSVWGATGGKGILLTGADQWRGITSSGDTHASWKKHSLKDLLAGGRTHHVICGFGDYRGGRFLAIGDNRQVFVSDDLCKSWKRARIPEGVGDRGQEAIAFGNGVFVCSFKEKVARSQDGGLTWTLHDHGVKRTSWRGLSFVNGEFWLTAHNGGGRRSKDGATWTDLPAQTPAGRFVQSPGGTLVNVARGRYDVRRSADGTTWKTVHTAPEGSAEAKDVTWDTAFVVYGKVNKVQ